MPHIISEKAGGTVLPPMDFPEGQLAMILVDDDGTVKVCTKGTIAMTPEEATEWAKRIMRGAYMASEMTESEAQKEGE